MAQIDTDIDIDTDTETPVPATRPRRGRRLGLVAAALAGLGLAAATFVVGGDDAATANLAEIRPDGTILIALNEGRHPKDLERRLNDLGVPVVVDFLEVGYGCDRSRSTGWSEEPHPEALFTFADSPVAGTSGAEKYDFVLRPNLLNAGETLVIEFQFDEFEDEIAAAVSSRVSTAPVGECVPVPNGSILDAEGGIAGG